MQFTCSFIQPGRGKKIEANIWGEERGDLHQKRKPFESNNEGRAKREARKIAGKKKDF